MEKTFEAVAQKAASHHCELTAAINARFPEREKLEAALREKLWAFPEGQPEAFGPQCTVSKAAVQAQQVPAATPWPPAAVENPHARCAPAAAAPDMKKPPAVENPVARCAPAAAPVENPQGRTGLMWKPPAVEKEKLPVPAKQNTAPAQPQLLPSLAGPPQALQGPPIRSVHAETAPARQRPPNIRPPIPQWPGLPAATQQARQGPPNFRPPLPQRPVLPAATPQGPARAPQRIAATQPATPLKRPLIGGAQPPTAQRPRFVPPATQHAPQGLQQCQPTDKYSASTAQQPLAPQPTGAASSTAQQQLAPQRQPFSQNTAAAASIAKPPFTYQRQPAIPKISAAVSTAQQPQRPPLIPKISAAQITAKQPPLIPMLSGPQPQRPMTGKNRDRGGTKSANGKWHCAMWKAKHISDHAYRLFMQRYPRPPPRPKG